MKKAIRTLSLLSATLCGLFFSCKTDERISASTQSKASVGTLTTFLSNTLNVPQKDVHYNSATNVFTVRTLTFTEEILQKRFSSSNEYKLTHDIK